MELFELLLYTTAFSQLSYGNFFNLCLANMFLKYSYSYKPTYDNQTTIDFSTFLITFTHLTLHMLNYYMYSLCAKCYSFKYGKYIIDKYNFLNKKYLNIRFKIIFYTFLVPVKYLMEKIILRNMPEQNIYNFKRIIELNFSNNNLKKENNFECVELKTNKQIDSFLDKILLETNKNK
jgi:hypothetical protein